MRDEAESAPVSSSGDPSGVGGNSGALTVVTHGHDHDDGYRSALCLQKLSWVFISK